ncbi:MAG TPA: transcriptional regulator [Ruminococcus sp.]|nr:transcriptional regulator [Ruminococcus sp.]
MSSIGKIGVLLPEIVDPLDYELLRGIHTEARACGYDVIVYCSVYNSQVEFQQDTYTNGLENIFTLLTVHRLDGVLFAADRFHNQELNAKIQNILVQRRIPCLVLGEERPPLQTIYPQQQDAMYRMTKHLIAVHGCKKIYCITGFPHNRPSEERTAGYRQAMQESGLPVTEQDIFYGHFWREIPQQIGRQIAEGKIPMPDGIVCASDSMAAALCESLIENGITVPEQVAVTGFDGSADAWMQRPKLTTVIGRDLQLGADAVRTLCGMMTGQTLPKPNCEQEIRFGESCGCTPEQTGTNTIDAYVLEHYFRHHIRHTVWHKQFYASDLINKMRNQNSLHGWVDAVDQVGHVLPDWEWIEICLCEDWCFDLEHPEHFRTEGYPQRMLHALSKRHGSVIKEQYLFRTADILPALQIPHEPKLLLLTSLHNRGQIFGFLATAYDAPEKICADDFYLSWCAAAVNGLDNLQHIMHRAYIKTQMELLTVRDPETGLYNRRGFAEHLPDILTEMRTNAQTPAVLLVTWQKGGGLLPFQPLLALSNAMRQAAAENAMTVRIDESVLAILYAENDVDAEALCDKIERAMKSLLGKLYGTIRLVTNNFCISDRSLRESEQAVIQAATALNEQAETAGLDLHAAIRRLRQEIMEKPQEDWNITDAAARLCISKSHLHRLYKQLTGINLMDDVIEARIAKAKQLLEFSDLRIQEIAQQCGYHNESHFMRQFKNKVGMTARQFRQSKQ